MKKKMQTLLSNIWNKVTERKEMGSDKQLELEINNFQGIGRRRRQEDSFYMSDYNDKESIARKGFLAVVADGMGGMCNGAEMSAVVTNAAREFYEQKMKGERGREREELLSMLSYIDARAKQLQEETDEDESGSTLVAVLIREQKLYFLSVGDSRIYLIKKDGIFKINREHNVKTDMLEKVGKGEISYEVYEDMTGKAGLTGYIGMEELDKWDVSLRPIPLQLGDCILLATDGVFNTIPEQHIRKIFEKDCEDTARFIRDTIEEYDNPKQDNYTGIIVKCVSRGV